MTALRGIIAAAAVAALACGASAFGRALCASNLTDDANREYVGNEACRRCHERIYDSYAQTAMARTIGPALQGLLARSFVHARSGVSYQVLQKGDDAVLAY